MIFSVLGQVSYWHSRRQAIVAQRAVARRVAYIMACRQARRWFG